MNNTIDKVAQIMEYEKNKNIPQIEKAFLKNLNLKNECFRFKFILVVGAKKKKKKFKKIIKKI